MIDTIDISLVKQALSTKKTGIGLDKYLYIMDTLHKSDVSKDSDFQKHYRGFYRLRFFSPECLDAYFLYMEKHKNEQITFEEILTHLYKVTSHVEASFASKLLATIDPNRAIWDANVLSQLSIPRPKMGQKDKIEQIKESVATYALLEEWYKSHLNTHNGQAIIRVFDDVYPDANITDIKKIDFALWSMGEKKGETKVVESYKGNTDCTYSREDLDEAVTSLKSSLSECNKALDKLEVGTLQHSHMVKKMKSFEISLELIKGELLKVK